MDTCIPYYGGKQKLASYILSLIPKHRIYVEPFFGGGAVFFRKGRSYLEVINDSNKKLMTFWSVVRNPKLFGELQTKIQTTLDSEETYKNAYEVYHGKKKKCSALETAWAVWVMANMGFCSDFNGSWAWDNGKMGSHSAVGLDYARQEFTRRFYERLRLVQISCRDALKVIKERDTPDTFFFLDPPYVGANQGHYYGYTQNDFQRLLETVAKIQGRFLLCHYENDILSQFVRKYKWKQQKRDLPINASAKELTKKRKTEVFTYNYNLQPQLFPSEDY